MGREVEVAFSPQFFLQRSVAMPAKKCTIWFDPKFDGYHFQCAYAPQFIEFVKAAIPASDRGYDPSTKTWMFAKKYLDAVENAATKFFGKESISVITEKQVSGASASPVGRTASIDSVMLEFMKLLPADAAIAAYRKAAMLLHPDRGGDMDKMSRLNSLWDRLEKEVYKP
jgi:hypothetical protein